MRRLILAALLAAVATPVSAEIRAVFVGIDKYRFSRANPETPEANFRDLSGAVRDVGTIKDALRRAYALDLDRELPGQCESANQVSITLTDYCATKAAILTAWNRQIDASRPGDTVILYFAGHGSRFTEATGVEQASGFNSTIMATDAREPGAQVPADILDREIRPIIDRATAVGVRVVTIFDSCNSGTATRNLDAEARTAPPLVVARVEPVVPAVTNGNLGAYRVHLAAAEDGQEAFETGGVGKRGGVFTAALARALIAQPGSSFADLAVAVREDMLASGQTRQTPHVEGALRATLGGDEVRVPIFEVVRGRDGVSIIGGSLTGITAGSTFVLYPSVSAALPGTTQPLATATATVVEPGRTQLRLDSPADLPGRLVARELVHRFETIVPIAVRSSDPALDAVLAGITHARIASRPQIVIAPGPEATQLLTPRGAVLARLPVPSDPAFAFLLDRALGKVARVNALLALASPPQAGQASFCIQNMGPDYQPEVCPRSGGPLAVNQPALISVRNNANDKRFLYVLGIDPDFGITLLLPPNGALDDPIAPGSFMQVPEGQNIVPDAPGSYRFVTLSTNARIPAQTLEQTGLATVDREVCLTRLSRQACADAARSRDPALVWVSAWAATLSQSEVK